MRPAANTYVSKQGRRRWYLFGSKTTV